MTKTELSEAIIRLIRESGLGFDAQIKALAEARSAIQPRTGMEAWRDGRKPLLKAKDRVKK